MRPKKLLFSEEDKKAIQRHRKKLSMTEINQNEMNEVFGAAEGGGGCGEQCMITCAHWCQPGCELTCSSNCRGECWDWIAFQMISE
jgi:hypothetical protein